MVIPSANLIVNEDSSGTYPVELATEPTTDVTVTLTTIGAIVVSPTELTFDSENWDTIKQVTVTANNDDVDQDTPSATITHSSAGGEYDGATPAVYTVDITNNDMADVIISSDVVTASEGSTGIFTIVLDTQPVADVTLALTGSNDEDFTVSPTTYTFTSINWKTLKEFEVTGIADDDVMDDSGNNRR